MKQFCCWVLEIGVLHATQPQIAYWEIWQAFNTRSEAVAERDKPQKIGSKAFHRATMRIRKYVPEVK